ncbi:uncharacterized protein LOC128767587 isoform X2 [Synchiropus splendidus]|uniref:uncharacterized protein LOC128767587 isoform X2 n=1 Tax=Synchiropus splendidus TaxID=270530 RepID=UPI00237E3653|nr:uncharacterized protein LOC128767587 isoform X2 [Synchiropus splendidus]
MATPDQGLLNLGLSNVTSPPSNIFTNRRGDDLRYRSAPDEFTTRQCLQRSLRERLQMIRDREKAAQHHNRQLMQQFEKAQETLREMMDKTAAMKTIRMEYERYLEENYPRWQQQLKIKTEAAQRKMMEDCLKICMRNTEEQARLAVAHDLALQGQEGNSGRDSPCGTSQNCQSVTNQDDQSGAQAHPAQHQTRLRVESDRPFLQGRGRPDHTSPMWAMDLATGAKALLHHLNTPEPLEGGLSCDELDTQPVRLRWSSAGSGHDSRRRMSEDRCESLGRNPSGSQRSSSSSSKMLVSPGQHSETAESRRLLGVEWRGESVGDNQLSSEGQSERSSQESACSGVKQGDGVTEEQHGGSRREEEEEEESLAESDEVSLGRSTTEDEDTEEDLDEHEGEELKSGEDEKIVLRERSEKLEKKKESNEEEEDGKECDDAEGEGDDSDDCIVAPKTRCKELKGISEEASESEDKDSSEGDSDESSDEDIERLLAPRQHAQKDSEERSKAVRNKLFQVGRSESRKSDPPSDPDSFYD